MRCSSKFCRKTGYTLVMEECGLHGGYSARLYRHVYGVDSGDLPTVMEIMAGSLEGPHEFYDGVHLLIAEVLRELCRTD